LFFVNRYFQTTDSPFSQRQWVFTVPGCVSDLEKHGDWADGYQITNETGDCYCQFTISCFCANLAFMDVVVEFNDAAFRHKISKEDILNALKTRMYDEI